MVTTKELRYDYPWWRDKQRQLWLQMWEEFDPGLWEEFAKSWMPLRALDKKTAEYLTIAIDIIAKFPHPYIDSHYHQAFDLGATVRALYEVVNISGEVGGMHARGWGHAALARVLEERRRLGEPVIEKDAECDSTARVSPAAKEQLWLRLLAHYEPRRFDDLNRWAERTPALREVDTGTQQLIFVATSTLVGRTSTAVEAYIQQALEVGCTQAELIDAIMLAARLEGVHAAETGLLALNGVLKKALT
jgi:alkylhydroperoxidase/carboxymuconolactone decarboxylase family protein YurZ